MNVISFSSVFSSFKLLFLLYEYLIPTLIFIISALTTANLTGHVERVGIENFELLKVLGTGGESLSVLSRT